MATDTISVGYRTIKVGFCIEDNNINQLLKSAQLSTILWGGMYNPIIPIGDKTDFASRLSRLFHPDLLLNISSSGKVEDFIKANGRLNVPFSLRDGLLKPYHSGGVVPTILDISNIINYHWENEFKVNKNSNCAFPKWNKKDSLSAVFTLEFGQYPEDTDTLYRYSEGFKKGMRAKLLSIPLNKDIPLGLTTTVKPIDLTTDRLTLVNHGGWSWYQPGFYVGYEDNFSDLVNFWNLRAAGVQLQFIPIKSFKRTKEHAQELLNELREREKFRKSPSIVEIWFRGEIDQKLIEATVNELLDPNDHRGYNIVDRDTTWNGLNVKPPEPNFKSRNILANIDWPYNTPSMTFQLPDKPAEEDEHKITSSQHFILTVNASGDSNYKGYTLDLPFIPDFNEWYSRQVIFSPDDLRIGKGSLGIIVPLYQETQTLRPIKKIDLIKKLFEMSDLQATESQSGLITQRVIEQLGGDVDDCRVFKVTGVRKLIEMLKPDQGVSYSTARDTIKDVDQSAKVASFDKHKGLHIQQLDRPNLTPEEVFDFLVEKNVFRIGIEPECPHCKLKFWISLTDAKETLECEYCGYRFKVTTQLRSRGDWCYRRSGLFGKDNNQEGSIPVILTLMQLMRRSREGFTNFTYSTALHLISKKHNIKCEIDLVYLDTELDNTTNILIGECKTKNQITKEDIENLVSVKTILDSEFLKVYLLFSKTHPFTKEEIDLFKALSKSGISPILFSPQDLEPYDPYENYHSNKIELPHPYAMRLEDMAENSKFIYLA